MALREEFERTGNWLFKRRGHLPLLLLPVIVAAMALGAPSPGSERLELLWQCACLLVGLAGLAVRAATIGFTSAGTSGNTRSQAAVSLNTTGMYSVVRHPLYLGNYLMWLAASAFPRVWWVPVFVTLVFWLYYERIMFAEEAFLRRKFGDAFDSWAASTPAWIPRLAHWRPPDRAFSIRAVLRREYSALLSLAAVFAALDVAGDSVSTGRLTLDPFWLTFATVVAVASVALRELRRRTRVLDVPEP